MGGFLANDLKNGSYFLRHGGALTFFDHPLSLCLSVFVLLSQDAGSR